MAYENHDCDISKSQKITCCVGFDAVTKRILANPSLLMVYPKFCKEQSMKNIAPAY